MNAPRYLTPLAPMWYYQRRVPADFAAVDRRGIVQISTKVRIGDDPKARRAQVVADRINAEVERYWEGLLRGEAHDHERHIAACKRARRLGVEYKSTAAIVATDSTPELLGRIARLEQLLLQQRTAPDTGTLDALLGAPTPPAGCGILVSELFEQFAGFVAVENRDKSPDQMRQWSNKRRRAANNLIDVIGDKDIVTIIRADMLRFRTWWQDRLMDEDDSYSFDTANSDLTNLSTMMKKVMTMRTGNADTIGPLFVDLRFKGKIGKRPSFSTEFIRDRLLAPGALAGLNEEARRAFYVLIETGARPSEICNLTQSTIHLDATVPHIEIKPDGRELKTDQSERKLPLVGVALAAMRLQPNGFPRYADASRVMSDDVNDYLTSNALRETDKHSLYSLRHSFKDRLRDANTGDEKMDALMGHRIGSAGGTRRNADYGRGYTLERMQATLKKIAFKTFPGEL